MLKIDTQGFELPVLRGAEGILQHVELIQAELSLVELYEGQAGYLELLNHLAEIGFMPWMFLPGFTDPGRARCCRLTSSRSAPVAMHERHLGWTTHRDRGDQLRPEVTGIAPYTTRIAEGLRDRGHSVRVLTTFPHYPQWRIAEGYGGFRAREQRKDVEVRRLRHYVPSRPVGVPRAISEITFGLHAASVPWSRPDVVICPSPALLSTALVRLRSRAAFGVQIQDLYSVGVEETRGAGPVTRALAAVEARVLRGADGVAVIHDRFRDRVVNDLGVAPDRVRVIRNWTHLPSNVAADRHQTRRDLGWGTTSSCCTRVPWGRSRDSRTSSRRRGCPMPKVPGCDSC